MEGGQGLAISAKAYGRATSASSVCSACSDDLAACNVNLAARAEDLDRLCTIDVEAIKVCGEQTEPEEAPMRACFTRALKRADAACPSGRFVF